MSSDSRKMLLLIWSAYILTPAGSPNPATTPTPGRPRDTSAPDDIMLDNHAGGSSNAVAPMRRVRFADADDAEDADSDEVCKRVLGSEVSPEKDS